VGEQPTIRRIMFAAAGALTIGFGGVSLITGFSGSAIVRFLQGLAVFAAGAVLLGGVIVLVLVHLADWQEGWGGTGSEEDFERIVERAERLAAGGWDGGSLTDLDQDDDEDEDDQEEYGFTSEEDFQALVRAAIDELPLEFHRALEHVAIVVSDGGARRRAYGLYEGDTVARDFFHDRIVIFRDTLLRDFGHDPQLLKAQVSRTVRHELAHHLGWGEKGVRGLGL
jgi:predicted Zn-dependent protease with MMP-like domain